jgi:hypothetical protein
MRTLGVALGSAIASAPIRQSRIDERLKGFEIARHEEREAKLSRADMRMEIYGRAQLILQNEAGRPAGEVYFDLVGAQGGSLLSRAASRQPLSRFDPGEAPFALTPPPGFRGDPPWIGTIRWKNPDGTEGLFEHTFHGSR